MLKVKPTPLRIIDNKRINLTDDEYQTYQNICKSYDRAYFKGESLFVDLFETDKDGIIVFLKPPKNYTSMEVFMFIMAVMQHQHLRVMYNRVDEAVADLKVVKEEASKVLSEIKKSRE